MPGVARPGGVLSGIAGTLCVCGCQHTEAAQPRSPMCIAEFVAKSTSRHTRLQDTKPFMSQMDWCAQPDSPSHHASPPPASAQGLSPARTLTLTLTLTRCVTMPGAGCYLWTALGVRAGRVEHVPSATAPHSPHREYHGAGTSTEGPGPQPYSTSLLRVP